MRDSDRYVTPRVVVAGLAVAGVIVLAAIGAVTYLSARGVDPAPMLKLVGSIAGGASGVLSLIVQLLNRAAITNTQRQTGRLATHVGDLVDVVADAPALPAADPWTRAYLPPVPPADAGRPGRHGGG